MPVYSVHSRQPQAWLEDLHGATTPAKYTTGTILALPLQSGPCLLGSTEPRTAIVLPPAPMVNQVKEKLLKFEHWFPQGGVASFTADLRSEFGGLDHKLRKNIFNSTMPTYARPEDGPARQVVYGVPPPPPPGLVRTQVPGVDHPLPALLRWAAHVRHQVDEATQLRHMVTAMADIIANTHDPQFPRRDFPSHFLPSGQFAWLAFSPVTMDLDMNDGVGSTFVYGSTRCTPNMWHEVPMGMHRNDLRIIHSLLVHWGGGIPKALDLPAPGVMDALPRVVAFCGLSTVPVDYDVTDPVVCPPWARREAEAVGKEVCGVVSCRRKLGGSSARCFGFKQSLLCGTHKGVLCTACDEAANEAPAAQPSIALPSHFPTMLTCLMPGAGELLTAHYAAVSFNASPVPQDTSPAPRDCPFRVQHEDDAPLPQPGVGGCRMVLRTRPGTILVVNGGRFAGFQVPTTDSDEVTAWRRNLLPPPHAHYGHLRAGGLRSRAGRPPRQEGGLLLCMPSGECVSFLFCLCYLLYALLPVLPLCHSSVTGVGLGLGLGWGLGVGSGAGFGLGLGLGLGFGVCFGALWVCVSMPALLPPLPPVSLLLFAL